MDSAATGTEPSYQEKPGRGRPQAEGTAEALQQADAGSCPVPAHGSLCPRFLSAFASFLLCKSRFLTLLTLSSGVSRGSETYFAIIC